MKTIFQLMSYQFSDVLRNRWVLVYGGFFLVTTESLFRLGGTGERVLVSLANVVLAIVPLVALLFGTLYVYNSREFIEMMLSQPIKRRDLFAGLFGGMALTLSGGFLLGVGLPFALRWGQAGLQPGILLPLLLVGIFLTVIFLGLAFWIALRFEDRGKGLGVLILVWLAAAVLYDGVVLILAYLFREYPLEQAMIAVSLLNPIDLSRILLLLKMDVAVLMGYTGAVFEQFFGKLPGMVLSVTALLLWSIVPLSLGMRLFNRRDF